MTDDDLRALAPRNKHDLEKARALIALGYPAVAPILPELLTWLQDYNWPVAQVLAPFLARIGLPLVPHLRRILETNDEIWKYWIFGCIILKSPEVAEALKPEIIRLATTPPTNEDEEGTVEVAQDALRFMGLDG